MNGFLGQVLLARISFLGTLLVPKMNMPTLNCIQDSLHPCFMILLVIWDYEIDKVKSQARSSLLKPVWDKINPFS